VNTFSHKTQWLTALALVSAAVLAGCAKKPPGCADPETLKTINSIVVDNVKGLMPKFSDHQTDDDPQNIKDGYYRSLKTEVVNIVSDGYNEQARKNSCRGSLSVSTVTGGRFSRDIVYSTQRTEDKDGGFLVEVQAFQPFVDAVAGDLTTHYFDKRYKGEWKGEYRCAGIDDAKDGLQGPFRMPVTMVVNEGMEAALERTTKGGGVESLSGRAGQVITLRGEGRNSPDDIWSTAFQGKVQGLDFAAQGEIGTGNRVLRQCRLTLKLPSN
jgi:hypothetical protein